jgi:D-alanyl-lipoteichoic acid acyltransferase DltB (MBOAT superfamily)
MPLDSPKYLGFLLIVWLAFRALPHGMPRRLLLIAASYGFYVSLSGAYVVCLLAVSALAYGGAHALNLAAVKTHRGKLFAALCILMLAPLLVFKYLDFILQIGWPASGGGPPVALRLLLPIGISFFTFAALGYLIDVYLDVVEPERDPVRVGLFLAFFAVITAGPIERANGLLRQLELDREVPPQALFDGARLILIGLVLKVVFANTLAVPINSIYDAPASVIPLELAFALIYFMFYIYADFSGYTLIAIGSALLFGLRVRPNFHQPFLSQTVPEFWRNWHMSLSSWVRDYIFTPLRMRWRTRRDPGMVAALVIAFVVIGVWHGAGWGYAIFGLAHGVVVAVSTVTLARRDRLIVRLGIPRALVSASRVVATFVLVMLIFVVYRARTLDDAMAIYTGVFSWRLLAECGELLGAALGVATSGALSFREISPVSGGWILIALIVAGDVVARRRVALERLPRLPRYVLYNLGAAALIYVWVSVSVPQAFYYYNF